MEAPVMRDKESWNCGSATIGRTTIMNTKIPRIGLIVLITLSAAQANAINDRRARSDGRFEGNTEKAGAVRPMLITQVWTDYDGEAHSESLINGQVFLDGNDTYWATSVHVGEAPEQGNAHWPESKTSAEPAPAAPVSAEVSPPAEPATSGMSFSAALDALKRGTRIARAGWNGEGQWVALSGTDLRPARVPTNGLWSPHSRAESERQGGTVEVLPAAILRNAQRQIVMGWVPSTGDLLAEDWYIVAD
jgi:hypothetical protein